MKHTEGKLQISRPDCQPPILAPTANPARPIVQACACWGADSANLERLRDCWNGCKGIKNPLAVGELQKACYLAWVSLAGDDEFMRFRTIIEALSDALSGVEATEGV